MALPSDYDFTKSTNDNHGVAGSEFFGKYADIRATRDYTYHVNYTQERQLWQDRAVESVVARTEAQANPWVVYTCGPMGAGKGYVLAWMSRHGYFPLEALRPRRDCSGHGGKWAGRLSAPPPRRALGGGRGGGSGVWSEGEASLLLRRTSCTSTRTTSSD